MKEQEESPEKELNEMEANNLLSERETKKTIPLTIVLTTKMTTKK